MIKTYKGLITSLKKNEVFVFGANEQGFHGAGSAGYASFGIAGNKWRDFNYASKPFGWQGKWNRKGRLGLQKGIQGMSYALVTVVSAGAKRSLSEEQWLSNIRTLYDCCSNYKHLTFYFAQASTVGLNGVSPIDIARYLIRAGDIPENLAFEEKFAQIIKDLLDEDN